MEEKIEDNAELAQIRRQARQVIFKAFLIALPLTVIAWDMCHSLCHCHRLIDGTTTRLRRSAPSRHESHDAVLTRR